MTKAQRILELYASMIDGPQTPAQIAELVGTTPSYVRTVARQRKGRTSEADIRYMASPRGKETRRHHSVASGVRWREKYRSDPAFRERELARKAQQYARKKTAALQGAEISR